MRKLLVLLSITALFTACGNPQKAVSYAEDKQFFDAVRKLEKKPNEADLRRDVIDLYNQAVRVHQDRIEAFRNSMDLRRFDQTIGEYNSLQRLSEAIRTSSVFREVQAPNYFTEVQRVKEDAAAAYYDAGIRFLDEGTKQGASRAYQHLQKTAQYVPNYRDVVRLQREAFEASIINIVINPIQTGFFQNNWNNNWNADMRIRFLHQQLAMDLGGPGNIAGSARFFSDMDAMRLNIRPDWVVDISWQGLSMPPNILNRYDRQLSKNIQVGKDSSGRPVFQTVRAVLHVTRYQNPGADIDYRIVDVETNTNLEWSRVNINNNIGVFETATFTGDSRALDQNDWALVNNRLGGQMNEQMMRDMYDQLLRELRQRIRARTL
jgi:hypothetical protein